MRRYYDEFGSGMSRRRPRRSAGMLLLDIAAGLLTALTAVAMVLTFLAPYVNPGRWWVFSILGLAAPVVYIASVVLALYWVIRWRWVYASAMLVLVVIGLFKVSLFYKPEFKRYYGEPEFRRGTITVMTFNVRNFYGDDGKSSVRKVMRLIGEQEPDILCLQEFNVRLADEEPAADLLRDKYNASCGQKPAGDYTPYDTPLMIYSKYRILRSGTILPQTSVWADLLVGEDTVRVFCNHLHSTAINASDDAFISQHLYLSDTAREVKIRSMVQRFRDNSILRAEQVDSIASVIGATRGRKVVCGDFNDTPMSYVYRTMSDGLQDAFRRCGRGYSHTFRGFYNMLRIDYALLSEGLEPLTYRVEDAEISDHLPLVVRMKKANN